FGSLAFEADEHGAVSAMPLAGQGERAVEIAAHPRGPRQDAPLLQPPDETPRGAHRPHGVRAGRSDADGEEVEDTDCHEKPPGGGGLPRNICPREVIPLEQEGLGRGTSQGVTAAVPQVETSGMISLPVLLAGRTRARRT